VSIHPLAIVLAIATGAVLAGIIGALLAVPVLAFLNSAIRVLAAQDPAAEAAELESGDDAVLIDAKPDTVPALDARAHEER
jgi:predicted PurR-regulated permease PerM